MNHAIEILEKEKELLERCLSDWDLKHYPEARKNRNCKLRDLKNAINKLKPI